MREKIKIFSVMASTFSSLPQIEDAVAHGWEREVERHRCAVRRIEQLLEELSEPLDEQVA